MKGDISVFTFGAAGDWGVEEEAYRTAANMRNQNVELAIGLGDLSYKESPGSAKYWTDLLNAHDLRNKSIICFGNHELISNNVYSEYIQEFREFSFPFNSFKHNNIH